MDEKRLIFDRLRDFGEKNFSTMSAYAKALGMRPQTLNNYLSGKSNIGGIIQDRLRKLGCDIEWLMTGKTEAGKKRVCTGEEEAMIERLRGMGITTLEQL